MGYTEIDVAAFAGLQKRAILGQHPKAGKAVEGYFRSLPQARDHPVFALTPA